MEMSEKEFLDSVSNPSTRQGYRFGLKEFVEWFGKSAEELLAMRQEDLTQKSGENIVEFKEVAKHLYERLGFERVGAETVIFGDGLHMKC